MSSAFEDFPNQLEIQAFSRNSRIRSDVLTCGEARLDRRILRGDADGEGRRRGRRRLRPGQGSVSREGHGHAGGLHGRLVVPQLVDPLLLQQ